jgi:dTDP-4-dehydrorhamnose reductase
MKLKRVCTDSTKALQLLLTNDCQGVYHLASTDNLNRVQLARRVLLYYPQNTVEVTHSITKLLNQSAERPLKGGLLSHKFLSQFPDFEYTNIDDYLKEQAFRKND